MPVEWDSLYARGAQWDVCSASKQLNLLLNRMNTVGRVLDAGCGTGRNLNALAAHGHRGYGVDISWQALSRATLMTQSVLLCADLHRLPFANHVFDAAYVGYVLQHLQMSGACSEIARVCRPGAPCLFVVLELTRHEGQCPYDIELSHSAVLEAVTPFFRVEKCSEDEYDEVDDYGPHKHKRTILLTSVREGITAVSEVNAYD